MNPKVTKRPPAPRPAPLIIQGADRCRILRVLVAVEREGLN
jgi:hypothetical protein